jgi:hypothetical protein
MEEITKYVVDKYSYRNSNMIEGLFIIDDTIYNLIDEQEIVEVLKSNEKIQLDCLKYFINNDKVLDVLFSKNIDFSECLKQLLEEGRTKLVKRILQCIEPSDIIKNIMKYYLHKCCQNDNINLAQILFPKQVSSEELKLILNLCCMNNAVKICKFVMNKYKIPDDNCWYIICINNGFKKLAKYIFNYGVKLKMNDLKSINSNVIYVNLHKTQYIESTILRELIFDRDTTKLNSDRKVYFIYNFISNHLSCSNKFKFFKKVISQQNESLRFIVKESNFKLTNKDVDLFNWFLTNNYFMDQNQLCFDFTDENITLYITHMLKVFCSNSQFECVKYILNNLKYFPFINTNEIILYCKKNKLYDTCKFLHEMYNYNILFDDENVFLEVCGTYNNYVFDMFDLTKLEKETLTRGFLVCCNNSYDRASQKIFAVNNFDYTAELFERFCQNGISYDFNKFIHLDIEVIKRNVINHVKTIQLKDLKDIFNIFNISFDEYAVNVLISKLFSCQQYEKFKWFISTVNKESLFNICFKLDNNIVEYIYAHCCVNDVEQFTMFKAILASKINSEELFDQCNLDNISDEMMTDIFVNACEKDNGYITQKILDKKRLKFNEKLFKCACMYQLHDDFSKFENISKKCVMDMIAYCCRNMLVSYVKNIIKQFKIELSEDEAKKFLDVSCENNQKEMAEIFLRFNDNYTVYVSENGILILINREVKYEDLMMHVKRGDINTYFINLHLDECSNSDDCIICRDNVNEMIQLNCCNHNVCIKCIVQWITHIKKFHCPYCTQKFVIHKCKNVNYVKDDI